MTYIEHASPRPRGTDHVDDYDDAGCPAKHKSSWGTWFCTRIDGHAGQHEAGIGEPPTSVIAAEWSDDDEGAFLEGAR